MNSEEKTNSNEFLTVENVEEDTRRHEEHHAEFDETTETLLSTDTDAVGPKTPVRKTSYDDKKSTPAIQRLHKTLNQISVHSPSDNIMSPCSKKLNSSLAYRKTHGSQPSAILKRRFKKDVQARTLDFGDDADDKTNAEEEANKKNSTTSEDHEGQENIADID